MLEIVPGQWYFSTDCAKCGANAPALRDDSRGETKIGFAGAGPFVVTCRKCGYEGNYVPSSLVSRPFAG